LGKMVCDKTINYMSLLQNHFELGPREVSMGSVDHNSSTSVALTPLRPAILSFFAARGHGLATGFVAGP